VSDSPQSVRSSQRFFTTENTESVNRHRGEMERAEIAGGSGQRPEAVWLVIRAATGRGTSEAVRELRRIATNEHERSLSGSWAIFYRWFNLGLCKFGMEGHFCIIVGKSTNVYEVHCKCGNKKSCCQISTILKFIIYLP